MSFYNQGRLMKVFRFILSQRTYVMCSFLPITTLFSGLEKRTFPSSGVCRVNECYICSPANGIFDWRWTSRVRDCHKQYLRLINPTCLDAPPSNRSCGRAEHAYASCQTHCKSSSESWWGRSSQPATISSPNISGTLFTSDFHGRYGLVAVIAILTNVADL